jgi:hypothetical protein
MLIFSVFVVPHCFADAFLEEFVMSGRSTRILVCQFWLFLVFESSVH